MSACTTPSLVLYVTFLGCVLEPRVQQSELLTPFPPWSHPPSYWLAAVAPPHKKSSLNDINNPLSILRNKCLFLILLHSIRYDLLQEYDQYDFFVHPLSYLLIQFALHHDNEPNCHLR